MVLISRQKKVHLSYQAGRLKRPFHKLLVSVGLHASIGGIPDKLSHVDWTLLNIDEKLRS